jgi:hypothetical protein
MMDLSLLQAALPVLSGSAVGFALGLIGGGGSILAVPPADSWRLTAARSLVPSPSLP